MFRQVRYLPLAILLSIGLGASGPVFAADTNPSSPATKPAAKGKANTAQLQSAVADLRKEFEKGKLRDEANYFTENPNADLNADAVFAMLERKIGVSSSMDGYIKWQLLSGLPDPLPEQYLPRVIKALRSAPAPEAAPGIRPDSRRALDAQLRKCGENEARNLMARIDLETDQVNRLNSPTLSYRNALAKLSGDSYDAVLACIEDAWIRTMAGTEDYDKAFGSATGCASRWLGGQTTPQQVNSLGALVVKLRREPTPQFLSGNHFSKDDGGYIWDTRNADAGRYLKDLQEKLELKAGNPGGGSAPQTGNQRKKRN